MPDASAMTEAGPVTLADAAAGPQDPSARYGLRPWKEYLPAIFQRQDALDLFLRPFETQFALFEEILAQIDRNFAVSFAPSGDFLPWLAQWVAHSFDEGWVEEKRRRFLAQAVELYRWRGTVRGLKRYLELWLDLPPEDMEIREGRWPGGMQIGVASRIGYQEKPAPSAPTTEAAGIEPVEVGMASHDYYVVATSGLAGEAMQVYYDARFVQRIAFEAEGFRIFYLEKGQDGKRTLRNIFHPLPPQGRLPPPTGGTHNVRRLSGLIDYRTLVARPPLAARPWTGGTLFAGEVPRPYTFIVDIRTATPFAPDREQRLRSLLDTEKPAHTEYYLRFKPAARRPRRTHMQIGVRSSVGLDTIV